GHPVRHQQAAAGRAEAPQQPDGRDPAAQADRPARLRLRRAVLGRLRARRDPADAVAGRSGRLRVLLEGRHRGRGGDAGGRRLLPAERARLPLRRRRLRGGHGEPRAQRRPHGGQRADGRLRPHRRGLDLLRGAERQVGAAAALPRRARGAGRLRRGRRADGAQPARGPGVGRVVRPAHLLLHVRRAHHGGLRAVPDLRARRAAAGREREVRHRGRPAVRHAHRAGARRPAGPHLLLRVRGADRGGGHLQRRAGVPAAQEQERRDDAAAARHGGHHHAHRGRRAGPADRGQADRRGPLLLHAGRRAGRRHREDRHRAAGRRGVLRLPAGLLLRHRRDVRHLVHGREHRVQRLPGAGLDPGQGRLPAPPAAHPRGPAGLQQRHRRAGLLRRRADRGLPRRRHRADPALRRRGLRLLHRQPAGDAAALDPAAADRGGPGRPVPDAPLAGHQRDRPEHDRHRAGDRAGEQVHPGRLHRDLRHGRDLRPDEGHPPALPAGGRGDGAGGGRGPDAAQPGPGHRAGLQAAQADPAGARLREGGSAQHPGGADRRRRRGGDGPAGERVGGCQHRDPAQGRRLALPRGDQPDPRLRPQRPLREPARRRHRVHPRVRGRPLVGADPAQPERAAAQGPAAVHPRRHGHLGALPARVVRQGQGAAGAGDAGRQRPPVAAGM
ncbi:MAG: Uncharacterized amino acid permease, GabP family, partial [uncultured Friedmanniella sp.]